MPIEFKCPQCSAALKLRDEFAGKRGKCPQCAATIVVPAATASAIAPGAGAAAGPGQKSALRAQKTAAPVAAAGDTIIFRCGSCGTTIRAPSKVAGRQVACPKCGVKQVVAANSVPAAKPVAAPQTAAPIAASATASPLDDLFAGAGLAGVAAAEQTPLAPLGSSAAKRTKKAGNRRLLLIGGAGAAVLLLVIGGLLYFMLGSGTSTPRSIAIAPPPQNVAQPPIQANTPPNTAQPNVSARPQSGATAAPGEQLNATPVPVPAPLASAEDQPVVAKSEAQRAADVALYFEKLEQAAAKFADLNALSAQIADAATAEQLAAQWGDALAEFQRAISSPRPKVAPLAGDDGLRDEELRQQLAAQFGTYVAEINRLRSLPGVAAILRTAAEARIGRESDPVVASKMRERISFLAEVNATTVLANIEQATKTIHEMIAAAEKITDTTTATEGAPILAAHMEDYASITALGTTEQVEATHDEATKLDEAQKRHRGQSLLFDQQVRRIKQLPGVDAILDAAFDQQADSSPESPFAMQIRAVRAARKQPAPQ